MFLVGGSGRVLGQVKARLEQDSVATEELKFLHSRRVECHHRVVIVDGLVHNEPVGRLLALQNGRGEVFAGRSDLPAFV